MKMKVTFEVDCEVLKNFISSLEYKNYNPDETVEKLMRKHIELTKETRGVNPPPPDPSTFTEKFLEKCKDYKVGEFTNIFLRGFLERGVASEEDVEEMQKASGNVPVKNLKISFGLYCNRNFRIPFPLLIDEEHLKFDRGNNFWARPSTIYGKKLYICSQWATQHRESIENWMRNYLPKWFEKASDEQKNEMENFIERNT